MFINDSRPPPLKIPGNAVKVRSLVDFFNQKASMSNMIVISRPFQHSIPSNKVKSIVKTYAKAVEVATASGATSRVSRSRNSGGSGISASSSGKFYEELPLTRLLRPLTPGVIPAYKNDSPPEAPMEEIVVSGGDMRETIYRQSEELRSIKTWKNEQDLPTERSSPSSISLEINRPPAIVKTTGVSDLKKTRAKSHSGQSVPMVKEIFERKGNYAKTLPSMHKVSTANSRRIGRLPKLERTSSLGVEISASPGETMSEDEASKYQTSATSTQKYFEKRKHAKRTSSIFNDKVTHAKEGEDPRTLVPTRSFSGSLRSTFTSVRNSILKKKESPEETADSKGNLAQPRKQTSVSSDVSYLTAQASTVKSQVSQRAASMDIRTNPLGPRKAKPAASSPIPSNDTFLGSTRSGSVRLSVQFSQSTSTIGGVGNVSKGFTEKSLARAVKDKSYSPSVLSKVSAFESISQRKRRIRAPKTFKTIAKERRDQRKAAAAEGASSESPVPFSDSVSREHTPVQPVSPLRVVKRAPKGRSRQRSLASTQFPHSFEATLEAPTSFGYLSHSKSNSSWATGAQAVGKEDSIEASTWASDLSSSRAMLEIRATFEATPSTSEIHVETPHPLDLKPPRKQASRMKSPVLIREMAPPKLNFREEKVALKGVSSNKRLDSGEEIVIERRIKPRMKLHNDEDWKMGVHLAHRPSNTITEVEIKPSRGGSYSSYDGQAGIQNSYLETALNPFSSSQNEMMVPFEYPPGVRSREVMAMMPEDYMGYGMEERLLGTQTPPQPYNRQFLSYTVNPVDSDSPPAALYRQFQSARDHNPRRATGATSVLDLDNVTTILGLGRKRDQEWEAVEDALVKVSKIEQMRRNQLRRGSKRSRKAGVSGARTMSPR